MIIDFPIWIQLALLSTCFLCSGLAKGSSDNATFTGRGFNPMSKYDPEKIPIHQIENGIYRWYHRKFGLDYREKFFLSGTWLVWMTDFFHFMESIRFLSLVIAIGLYVGPLAILLYIPRSLGFHLTYK